MPVPIKFPLAVEGSVLSQHELLAPGVKGYAMLSGDGSLYVPLINAVKEGSGDVGKFLDLLPTDRDVKVPSVLSPRLEGMLHRRGFVMSTEFDEDGQMLNIWLRRAAPEVGHG